MVVKSGLGLAGMGLAIGIVLAGFATRLLASALHGVDRARPDHVRRGDGRAARRGDGRVLPAGAPCHARRSDARTAN